MPTDLSAAQLRAREALAFVDGQCPQLKAAIASRIAIDDWSIGYILGVADAKRQHHRGNVPPDTEDYAVGAMIFMGLFGASAGSRFFGRAMDLQARQSPSFLRGLTAGGIQAFGHFKGNPVPVTFEGGNGTGLATLFRGLLRRS